MVEDSPGDVRLTQEAFRNTDESIKLHVTIDGVEAMAFLRHEGAHTRAPRPDIILLDLNLPKMDGREVLAHIKSDEDLKTIPTVILTTSEAEADVLKCYQLQANCYLSKPVQLYRVRRPREGHQRILADKSAIAAASITRMNNRSIQKAEWEIMNKEVLLVEDSPGDVRLTQEAFRDANRSIRLHVATDGVEAMAFLKREGAHADAPRPDIILLDLNLPKMDGREVLAHIKADSGLKMIPIVILTTSEAETDIVRSYQLQANCYLSKPVQFDDFASLVNVINDFWLTKVKLPQQKETAQT